MGAYTTRWALTARLLNLGLEATPMTWPHPSMRLLFALQIFDAFSLQLELPSGSVNTAKLSDYTIGFGVISLPFDFSVVSVERVIALLS